MSVLKQAFWPLFSQRSLILTQKRFNMRESIHRYVEPNKFKKHMLAACEPYVLRKYQLPNETCKGSTAPKHELHPLETILVKELLVELEKSQFILFIQYNYTPFQSDRVYKNNITKSGGKFHSLNNNIYKETFRIMNGNTSVINLFNYSRHALVSGNVDKLFACIKVLNKAPQYILLGGFVDQHLYSVNQLSALSAKTDIDQCRANLLAILDTPAVDLSSYLQQHSETLEKPE